MVRGLAAFARARRGVAAVEFGLFAPIVLLMLAGLVDFSFYIGTRIELEQALRAGAQYALRDPNNFGEITNAILAATDLPLVASDVTIIGRYCQCLDGTTNTCRADIAYTPCGDGTDPAEYLQFVVTTQYDPMFIDLPGLTSNMDVTQQMSIRVR